MVDPLHLKDETAACGSCGAVWEYDDRTDEQYMQHTFDCAYISAQDDEARAQIAAEGSSTDGLA